MFHAPSFFVIFMLHYRYADYSPRCVRRLINCGDFVKMIIWVDFSK